MNKGKELIQLLLAGYFHQDWGLEAYDDLGVVRNFIECEGIVDIQSVLDAFDQVLLNGEEKAAIFLEKQGCEYCFSADGLTAKEWLERLRSEFERQQNEPS